MCRPQAYAYASGRPLVYSDPDGRIIRVGSTAAAGVLNQLRTHGIVGHIVRELDGADNVEGFVFEGAPGDLNIIANHGGYTETGWQESPFASCGGGRTFKFRCAYNTSVAAQTVGPYGIQATDLFTLGHELGHVYGAYKWGMGPGPSSDNYAMWFENFLRIPGPARPVH